MEVNISNTMEINWWLGLVKTTSIHPTGMGSANAWRVLLCDTTDKRIGCTHALIPNRMYCIPFNAKPQMELVGSVRLFAKSFHRCPCCMFSGVIFGEDLS